MTSPAVDPVVKSSDVPVVTLQNKIQSAKTPEEKEKLKKDLDDLMQTRELIRASVIQIIEKSTDSKEQAQSIQTSGQADITNYKVYREVTEYYKQKCFNWHNPKYAYALHQLHLFSNLCEANVPVERIKTAIDVVSENLKKEDAAGC
ncbi:LGMN protein, partial [Atractosteus spatula]|nr:LGMN protein [Atractosteus spatula]